MTHQYFLTTLPLAVSVLASVFGAYFLLRRSPLSKTIEASKSSLTVFVGVAALLVACVTTVYQWKTRYESSRTYEAEIQVLDPSGRPSSDAKVWSSKGGELTGLNGKWVLRVPGSVLKPDRRLVVYAEAGDLESGSATIDFDTDRNPSTTIRLNSAAALKGIVVDATGAPVPDAIVTAGSAEGSVMTRANANGTFALIVPSPNVSGRTVHIRAEAPGLPPTEITYDKIGGQPVAIVLKGILSPRSSDNPAQRD